MVRGRGRQTDREKTAEQAEARVERGGRRAEREAWAARWRDGGSAGGNRVRRERRGHQAGVKMENDGVDARAREADARAEEKTTYHVFSPLHSF
jgi:hypothetical protein